MIKKILSNKERIQARAEEAAAGEMVKIEKKKPAPRKKAAKSIMRQKVVWKVFDTNYKEVACFPYSEKTNAYSTAEGLTRKKNKSHFVNEVSVPLEDD
ncbi:MAG: hypothetical protein MRJ65_06095 [Candidatus Brocadiaceae bacterium]|nr:hypothetical protein [Candidatus Brocadiaceae bacterium]